MIIPPVVLLNPRPTQKDVVSLLAATIFVGCSYNIAQRAFNCWPSKYQATVQYTDKDSVIVTVMQGTEVLLAHELEIYPNSTPKSIMKQICTFQSILKSQKICPAHKIVQVIKPFTKDINNYQKTVDAKTTLLRLEGAYILTRKVEYKQAIAYVKFLMEIPKEKTTCSSSSD